MTETLTLEQLTAQNDELRAEIARQSKALDAKKKPDMLAADLTNIEYSLVGKILTLKIDLSKEHGPSGSGKNIVVASTHGNRMIGGVKIGINAYRKA